MILWEETVKEKPKESRVHGPDWAHCYQATWVFRRGGRGCSDIYIYTIYTPNLGLEIAVFVRERERGRFRGSNEGAGGSTKGARGSREEARGSTMGQCKAAAEGTLKWLYQHRLELPSLFFDILSMMSKDLVMCQPIHSHSLGETGLVTAERRRAMLRPDIHSYVTGSWNDAVT